MSVIDIQKSQLIPKVKSFASSNIQNQVKHLRLNMLQHRFVADQDKINLMPNMLDWY